MTPDQLQALCYLTEALTDELQAGSLRRGYGHTHPQMLADMPVPRIPHTFAYYDTLMEKAGHVESPKLSEALLRPIALEIQACKRDYRGE